MNQCVTLGQCSAITRSASGAVRRINDPLTNSGFVDTHAVDFNLTWNSPDWAIGRFMLTSSTSHLLDYIDGATTPAVHREGTERGSPAQGFPEWKSTTSLNWDWQSLGATLTNRYTSSLTETANGNSKLGSYSLWDLQARWQLPMSDRFMLSAGVNNITNVATPGCFSCDVNNMDPTVYDVPGRFGYVRFSIKH
jgi:iron complex outermembrane receptor protein